MLFYFSCIATVMNMDDDLYSEESMASNEESMASNQESMTSNQEEEMNSSQAMTPKNPRKRKRDFSIQRKTEVRISLLVGKAHVVFRFAILSNKGNALFFKKMRKL